MDLDTPTTAAILGAGGLGAIAKSLFGYLTSRGERQATENILTRVEKEITEARGQISTLIRDLMGCQKAHALCEARVTILTSAVNEARKVLGQPPVVMPPSADDDEHTTG